MKNRREFLKQSAILSGGLMVSSKMFGKDKFKSGRIRISKRNFSSKIIDMEIDNVKKAIKDPELAWMFEKCFPNTLDTTVKVGEKDGKPDTFVITGDIHAMWLRDSTAQVWPYLPYANKDKKLKSLLKGVINRQTSSVLFDPYANAFNFEATGSEWESDITDMKPELHERKWEIDSLCYTVRLAYGYWKETGDSECFDKKWKKAMKLIVKTFKEQQRIENIGPYAFMRRTQKPSDTVPLWGAGNPTKKVGLIHSMFRPSDDSCVYPLLIPSNLFAVVILRNLAEMFTTLFSDMKFALECNDLADDVEHAVKEYAIYDHLDFGKIYAYEVDGFGNKLFMDDANIPSLLSLPYLGVIDKNDGLYQRTRKFLLSGNNPYFFKGKAGEGIGGPHVGMDMVWPMSIIMRALTSIDDNEIILCLKMLKKTHADTGFMHESFHKDNPEKFSRSWFAWANTLFGELVLKIYHSKPELLDKV